MPANLTPPYHKAEERFRQAETPEDKIKALREMFAVMPKHKGTDHLQADLKKRIAQLTREAQQKPQIARADSKDHVVREGAGQVALVGIPNSGKSSIVASLTHAHAKVAEFPMSTFDALPGMMPFEDIQIQLIDLPPLSEAYTPSWVYNVIRTVDLILLTVDLSMESPEEQVLTLMGFLEDAHMSLIGGDGAEDFGASVLEKRTLFVGTKYDAEGAGSRLEELSGLYGEEFRIVPVSVEAGVHVESMKRALFEGLHVVRIYTKMPRKEPDMAMPYVLPVGSTVVDVAQAIHRELVGRLKYARIWGSEKYQGQQVQRDYVVADGDVIEMHM
ncbi:MAG: GTPase [Candidatus Latescibacterota bacterium]